MKKVLIFTAVVMITMSAIAQSTFKLPFTKSIGKKSDGKWESWPSQWEELSKNGEFVPVLTLKKIDEDIINVDIYFGGSLTGVFKANVIYDPTETSKIRKNLSNNSLTAYRYSGSNDYFWTENITLVEMITNPKKWTTTPNAKIYTWESSLGNASVYTSNAAVQAAKKYITNFTSTKKQIKGTWTDWTNWSSVAKNSYFELKIVTEGRVYTFKYYENGKLVKDYKITYDDAETQKRRETSPNIGCYKIDGLKNGWIFLLNTTMGNVFTNPDKWSQDNDAVIQIWDAEKAGMATRIK